MRLVDLRKLSIRQQVRIRFRMGNGMECVVTEHGIAQVPGLRGVPDFNLEQELASAAAFELEPAASGSRSVPPARRIGRSEMLTLVESTGPGGAAPEHEEE